MTYIREDIPTKFLSVDDNPIEGLHIEINLPRKKWLLSCSSNPNKSNIGNYLESLSRNLDLYTSKYNNIIVLGDTNVEVEENQIESFFEVFELKSLNKQQTCFKIQIHLHV